MMQNAQIPLFRLPPNGTFGSAAAVVDSLASLVALVFTFFLGGMLGV